MDTRKIESILWNILSDNNLTAKEKINILKEIQNTINSFINFQAAMTNDLIKCPKCLKSFSSYLADLSKDLTNIPELKTKVYYIYYICPYCGHKIFKSQQPAPKKYREGKEKC